MNFRTTIAGLLSAAAVATTVLSGIPASAQDSHHRQQTKNNWRNATIGSGAVGVLGLLTHNTPLAVIGGAGALYSASRYEHDRKSQSKMDHDRAAVYGRSSFTHNGHRYVRHTTYKHGHKYYSFVRG